MNYTNRLDKYLELIQSNFDVQQIINEKQDDQVIKDYYLINHLGYLVFHNWMGFMHMGISQNKVFKKEDLLAPLNIIDIYIKNLGAKNILELGAGNGSSSVYLAQKNPRVNFSGLDLSKKILKRHQNIKNYNQDFGDYHDLSKYKDNYFEIVFIIEALCHSNYKKGVLNQVYRKLNKDGVLIIIDGYACKPSNKMTAEEKLAQQLTEKSMAVDKFDTIVEFKDIIKRSKFRLIKEKDLTKAVLPTVKRFEKLAKAFYKFSLLTKILKITLPKGLIKNSIAGLLMPTLLESKVGCYYLHILKKI